MTTAWRQAYRILRSDCGLTHHQVRAIFAEKFGGLEAHRNLLHKELKEDEAMWEGHADSFAVLLNTDDHRRFALRLREVVWAGDEPLCYTLVRMIERRVRSWNSWGEAERQHVKDAVLRRLARHEKRTALRLWDERMLHTYLNIRGLDV